MRFLNGTYSITFQYERISPLDKGYVPRMGKNPTVRQTICTIREIEDGKLVENCRIVSTGKSTQSIFDGDNKAVARKLALQRALRIFSRTKRTQIWSEYLNKVSNGKKLQLTLTTKEVNNLISAVSRFSPQFSDRELRQKILEALSRD